MENVNRVRPHSYGKRQVMRTVQLPEATGMELSGTRILPLVYAIRTGLAGLVQIS